MTKRIYIAETNEAGAITCVWVSSSDARSPKVFDPHRDKLNEDRAEFAGATQQGIAAWIVARQRESSVSRR